jgi:hypothetical protein
VPIPGASKGYAVQEDNVAAEYNIPPQASYTGFYEAITTGLKYLENVASKHNLKLAVVPALHFDPVALSTPHAQKLGCEPDLNAWTEAQNPRPRPPESLRTAAGHVHVSWSKPDAKSAFALCRLFDVRLGLPSVLVTEKSERRELYGRAGACRIKPYGVEYRVLDNFWLTSQAYCISIYESVLDSMNQLNYSPILDEIIIKDKDVIQQAINTHDKELAKVLMDKYAVYPWG